MMVLIAPRSAKLVEAQRRPVHPARRLRLSASSASSPCCCSGTRASPTGRSDSATRSSAPVSASPAHRRRTRSPARCPSSAPAWHPAPRTSNATSAVRSCSRSSARCSPPGTPRRWPRRSPLRRTPRRSPTASRPSSEVVRRGRGRRRAVPAVRRRDHGRGDLVVPRRRRLGVPRRDRRHPARRDDRLLPLPAADEEQALLAQYHEEDTGSRRPGVGGRPVVVVSAGRGTAGGRRGRPRSRRQRCRR